MKFLLMIIIVIAITYMVFQRNKSKKVSMKNESLIIVNQAMETILKKNHDSMLISNNGEQLEFWGKDVMVFRYQIKTKIKNLQQVKKTIEQQLNFYAQKKHLFQLDGKDTFKITDIWEKSDLITVEVAYIMNKKTLDYVNDIKELF